jgi:hypothetical protein
MQPQQNQTIPAVSSLIRNFYAMDGDGTYERPSVGLSLLDPDTSEHPTKGTCKICDRELPLPHWRNCDQQAEDGRWLFRGWLPVNCCDECMAKSESSAATRGEADWQERCPVDFKIAWNPDRSDDEARKRVMQWDAKVRKGLLIRGPSGFGKTRIAWLLAHKVALEGRRWLWLDSLDYVEAVPKDAERIDVLFLDDLGNEPLGQQAETRLLRLIKTRCENHRPLVITTQHTGDSLAKRFREGATAQAIIRRLREFCEDVQVHAKAPY